MNRTLIALATLPLIALATACGNTDEVETNMNITATAEEGELPGITVSVTCEKGGTAITEGSLAGKSIEDLNDGSTKTFEFATTKVTYQTLPEVKGSVKVTPEGGDCTTKVHDFTTKEELKNVTTDKEITMNITVPEN